MTILGLRSSENVIRERSELWTMTELRRRVAMLFGAVLMYIASATAQSRQPFMGSLELDIGGGAVSFFDTITFAPIDNVPQLGIFLAVLFMFYFIEKNILEQVFSAIDEAVYKAIKGEGYNRLHRRYSNYEEYPTGAKGIALAVAFISANGLLFVVGYFGAMLLALLGYLAVLLGHFKAFGGEEDSDSSSSSESSNTGGSTSDTSSTTSKASKVADFLNAGSDAAVKLSEAGLIGGGGSGGKNKRIAKAVSVFEPGANLSDKFDMVNNANFSRLKHQVATAIKDYEAEGYEAKDDVSELRERVERLLKDLEEANERHRISLRDSNYEFRSGGGGPNNELHAWLMRELPAKDRGTIEDQLTGINQVIERLLTNEEKLDSDFHDHIDQSLERIKVFWQLNEFVERVPFSIDQLIDENSPELQAALNNRNITFDSSRIQTQLYEFKEMREAYFALALILRSLLQKEHELGASERNKIMGLLAEEHQISLRRFSGTTKFSVKEGIQKLEKGIDWYIENGKDPNGDALNYRNSELDQIEEMWTNVMRSMEAIDDRVGRKEDYTSTVYDRIEDLAARAETDKIGTLESMKKKLKNLP